LRKLLPIYHLEENQGYSSRTSENYNNFPSILKKKKILLVDDEPDITSSLKIGLEDNGFAVDTFNDSVLALSNFQADMYDLILLDVKMPKINGFELYEKIREIDSKVKACFITAYEVYYQSLKEIFPDMDFDCYVKPIDIYDLVIHVKKHLDM
jgi:two-component system, OmpR family, response regulator ChvI